MIERSIKTGLETGASFVATSARRFCPFILAGAVILGCKAATLEVDSIPLAMAAIVSGEPDLDAGVNGKFVEVMSTALTSAPWQSRFFETHPDEQNPATSALVALAPQRVLVQVYDSPRKGDTKETAYWDFSELDAIVLPLLTIGVEPLIQIVHTPSTPPWLDPSADPADFAEYCAGIVSYYNGSGVNQPDGAAVRSGAGKRITWWAILADPNTDTSIVSGSAYASIYSSTVAKMLSVDPAIMFAAPEFNDCIDVSNGQRSHGPCDPEPFVPAFLAATTAGGPDGGLTPINALSIHMFSTNLALPQDERSLMEQDTAAFTKVIPTFASDVSLLRQDLRSAGRLDTPIWVTENQVNSDTPALDGSSNNFQKYGPAPFQADSRGTDVFFAAWRPYLFSRLGKVGTSALFQWQYTAGRCPSADAGCSLLDASDTDRQNAEVDYVSGKKYLSYWVDSALAHKFTPGQDILKTSLGPAPGPNVEILATRRTAGVRQVVVVMVVNASVQSPNDIDGPGAPNTVVVDLNALLESDSGLPWSASLLTIDQNTDRAAGPAEVAVSLQNRWIPISFAGYGVVFITLEGPAG